MPRRHLFGASRASGCSGDRASGLGWNKERQPYCEKCKTVVTLWETNASHAFHLGKVKRRRAAGKKGEGKHAFHASGQQASKPKSLSKSLER